MGARKRLAAEKAKEQRKSVAFAILRNCPTSPRKMRYVIDMIRGQEVNRALDILKYSNKMAAGRVEKLLLSAIANWQQKNADARIDDANLIVKVAKVDEGRMIKRVRTAPQGRAYRMQKRSNHVTLIVERANNVETQKEK